jgi:DNA-binding transcriptional MerR regulator
MIDYEYSTAYVSGMTKIPQRTIQEYVSAFRKYFSNQAGQNKKGRRFLPGDVDKLHAIKRLRSERIPDDEIEKYLSGELKLTFKMAHQFSTKEVMDMAAHSMEIFDRAEKMLEKANEQIYDAKAMQRESKETLTQARNEITAIRNQLNRIETILHKFREWQGFVMKEEPAFDMYTNNDPREPLAQEMPREKKRGFFGLG